MNEKTGKKTKFRQANALALPFQEKFFDFVNDDGCLHHIAKKDWRKYLQNVGRVLKDNGLVRIKVFSKNCGYYEKNKPKTGEPAWIKLRDSNWTYFFKKMELNE